ncbi:MAG TPA: tripartite tricarboxylate transporter permease [Vicinamibacteria bacterium]|nr:tripartite tricarboxylate transporter permease [Vicinamibacteria bacterium]
MATGWWLAFTPLNVFLAAAGALTGTVVGMLPGLGPINAIAILIPVCFSVSLPPESVLILLTAVYYGSQYGNSISTILLNVPGTPSATVTALDGYALTRKGRAASALAISAVSSFVGGMLSLAGLVLLAPLLARMAIQFGPAEYFALMVFALSTLSGLSGGSFLKAAVATLLGLAFSTVGFDPNSAVARYTLGEIRLLDGVDFVVLTIGLFALSEVIFALESGGIKSLDWKTRAGFTLEIREWLSNLGTMVRGSLVGFAIGVLPGAGGTVASFIAYATEKRLHPDGEIGRGDLRGVAAPEAANNAAATGAMIPLLTLGVPGSGTTAVLLGALLGLDVAPGPLFLTEHAEVFWALSASMVVGNVVLLFLNLPLVGAFASILLVPPWFLYPLVLVLSLMAAYSVNGSTFDVVLAVGFGVLGYVLRKLDFPLAPVVLGFVLGGLMETSLRRAMALSGGGWEILFSSWTAITIWGLAVFATLAACLRRSR